MNQLGLIGAAIGLGWAVLDFFVLMPLVERPLRMGLDQLAGPERERMARRLRLIRAIFAWQFVVFPVIGYGLGQVMAP